MWHPRMEHFSRAIRVASEFWNDSVPGSRPFRNKMASYGYLKCQSSRLRDLERAPKLPRERKHDPHPEFLDRRTWHRCWSKARPVVPNGQLQAATGTLAECHLEL